MMTLVFIFYGLKIEIKLCKYSFGLHTLNVSFSMCKVLFGKYFIFSIFFTHYDAALLDVLCASFCNRADQTCHC